MMSIQLLPLVVSNVGGEFGLFSMAKLLVLMNSVSVVPLSSSTVPPILDF